MVEARKNTRLPKKSVSDLLPTDARCAYTECKSNLEFGVASFLSDRPHLPVHAFSCHHLLVSCAGKLGSQPSIDFLSTRNLSQVTSHFTNTSHRRPPRVTNGIDHLFLQDYYYYHSYCTLFPQQDSTRTLSIEADVVCKTVTARSLYSPWRFSPYR